MKSLLRFTAILLIILIVAAVGIAILLLTFDLNRLKPLLVDMAAERGAQLQIPGDLEWQLYPNLGLKLGAMQLHSNSDGSLLAAIDSASVSVQLKPLLNRQIFINGIDLVGMQANYQVDAQGNNPWQPILTASNAAPPRPTTSDQGEPPQLEIQRIRITGLNLQYHNAQNGDHASIEHGEITSHNLALTGTPFDLSLTAKVQYNTYPSVHATWQSPLSLNLAQQQLNIENGELNIDAAKSKAKVVITSAATWSQTFASQGKLVISGQDLNQLLRDFNLTRYKPADANALKQFNLQFSYELADDKLRIKDVKVRVDETDLKGDLSIQHFDAPQIRGQWHGGKVQVDRYLPEPESTTAAAPAAPPQPLPFAALRALDLKVTVGFDEVNYKGITLTQPQLQVDAKNGLLQLTQLQTQIADGTVAGSGALDARKSEAQLHLNLDTKAVDVGKLLMAFAEQKAINGKANATVTITSQGKTDQQLQDNLKIQALANSEGLKLAPFNLEEQFCKAVALLQQTPAKAFDWPQETLLEPVKMQIDLVENTLKLTSLNAEIANLLGNAEGQLNLSNGKFNVPFALSIGDFASSRPGCLPIEEKWRKRALPIRCKGSLDNIGAKTCLPDTELLTAMLKEKARVKIEEKKDELEQDLGTKARGLLEKELGTEKGKKTEETVRGIYDQLKGKK